MLVEKLFTPYLILEVVTPKMMKNFEPFELEKYSEVNAFIDHNYSDLDYFKQLDAIDKLLFEVEDKTYDYILKDYKKYKMETETIQKAYLSGLISDDLIEKAWKKQPVGTVTTRKDGQQYRKVSETGNMDQDWKLVSKDKTQSGEPQKEGNKPTEDVKSTNTQISQKDLQHHAKNTSESALQAAVKNSADENVRKTAHEELDRREKEEQIQEEEKGESDKEEDSTTLEENSKNLKDLQTKSMKALNNGDYDLFNKISEKLSKAAKLQGELIQKDKYSKGEKSNQKLLDKGLSQEEIDHLQNYTGSRYKDINQTILNGDVTKELQKEIDSINNGLEKLDKVKGTVYRGIKVNNIEKELENWQKGGIVNMSPFTSTSENQKVANSFGSFFQMEIQSKSGRNMKDVSQYGEDEGEVLFKTNTNFKISSVKVKRMKHPLNGSTFISKVTVKLKEL